MAGKHIRKCNYCNDTFMGRIDSLFCSASCRSGHWQRNKAYAKKQQYGQLNRRNKTVRKFYVADKHDGVLSCPFCKTGRFYFPISADHVQIKCDDCGVTYERLIPVYMDDNKQK